LAEDAEADSEADQGQESVEEAMVVKVEKEKKKNNPRR